MTELHVHLAPDGQLAYAEQAAAIAMATCEAVMPPIVDRLPDHLARTADPAILKGELIDLITKAIVDHPRSQQVAIGPSEIGHDCARRIGHKLLGTPENPGDPNWKATVGTAVHAWLEEVMTNDNPNQHERTEGHTRWIVEATVAVGQILGHEITGHCDLFDRVTGTVVDWKTVGPTQLTKYKSKGPGNQYRVQAHLYGRGWARRGQTVKHVAVMFLPRNGELRDAYFWHEPYDEQVAIDGLTRAEGIALAVGNLGPAAPALLPTADAFCSMCPYFQRNATDLTTRCPGDPGSQRQSTPALTIAR